MRIEFEQKIADFIRANDLFALKERILLGVSGGADSIALLYTMCALKNQKVLNVELFCAHINHQLRVTEADNDERFVVAQADELKVPVVTKRVDVYSFAQENKLSIETAARQLRIESLLDIAGINNCNCIATGHQMNDNAETILQRISRGTGFRGLCGIWPMRAFGNKVKFVRPLLCATRDEVTQYLQRQNLKWQTDHTNTDCAYRRNYIRHRLLPELQKECSGSLIEQLSKLSEAARGFYEKVCSCADKIWPTVANRGADETMILDLRIFQKQPQPVQVELIWRCLDSINCGQRDLTRGHFKRILHLAGRNVTDKKIELPAGFIVYREYENLILCRAGLAPPIAKAQAVILEIPGQTQFGQYSIETTILDAGCWMLDARGKAKSRIENRESRIKFIERFDIDKLKLPLIIRHRQTGDRFVPLGMSKEKKVGKFLTAVRMPHDLRQKILIVADAEKIIWVWPVRMSEQARITDSTQKILQLQIKNRHHGSAGLAE